MTDYQEEIFDLTNNPNYTYYKLYVNGKCEFDDFLENLKKNKLDQKSMMRIIGYMDCLSAQKLPKTIYNYIESGTRTDLYEFKKDNLRVYVIDQRPCVYIVMGGYKATQKKDISRLVRKTKDFPENNINEQP